MIITASFRKKFLQSNLHLHIETCSVSICSINIQTNPMIFRMICHGFLCLNVYFRNRNSQCQLQHSSADFRIRHHCCKHKRIPYCQIFEFSGFHSSVLSEAEELFGLSIMQKDGFYKKKFSTKSHMALVNKIRNEV